MRLRRVGATSPHRPADKPLAHPGAHSPRSAPPAPSATTPFLRLRYDNRILTPDRNVGLRPLPDRRPRVHPRHGDSQHRVGSQHPGPPPSRRPPTPGHLRPLLARRRHQHRGSTGRPRRASQTPARQHPENPVRPDRPPHAPRRAPAPRQRTGPGRHRRGQQSGRGRGGAHVSRRRPVARGLPQLRERRRARPGRPQRRLGRHGRPDAGQGALSGRARHACHLAGRLRHRRPGVLRLRPSGVRAGRAAQRGLRAVLLHRRGRVPG